LRDEGVSAFKGKNRENPDVHGMAAFLAAVKTGRVPIGSFLIVENLDRLTRESIVPAVNLFTGILIAGVKIVQLQPVEQVFTAGADMTGVMLALVELSRGNSESRMKSERVGEAWAKKRKQAAAKVVLTRSVPAWIDYTNGGKLAINPEKSKVVRRLFRLAIEGFGLPAIAAMMNKEKVPPLCGRRYKGRRVVWSAGGIHKVLTSRAVIGEYQPHTGTSSRRQPDGEPVPDYYPPVVDAGTFAKAQAALHARATVGRGRRGKHLNLFAGLLKDARTGGSLSARHVPNREPSLFPTGAVHGRGGRWSTFPLRAFEQAILSQLIEVRVEDIQPDRPPARTLETLSARLAEIESLVKKWRGKMDRPELVDVVADKLADLERERRDVAATLTEAQRDAGSPLTEAVRQLRVVGKSLDEDASEENRLRCRSAIRRAVESVWCLFSPGRGQRLAAVQVRFLGGAHRDYLIVHRAAGKSQWGEWPARTEVRSFAMPGAEHDLLDLRNPSDVADLDRLLPSLVGGCRS
jgi:DNA invertase Pin-like site-specific DNA recombinase